MSSTRFTAASPQAMKVWAKKAMTDAVKATTYGKLKGKSARAIVQVKNELKKGPGDRSRFRLRSLPTGTGVEEDETLEGNEEALDYKYFDITLGEKRHATKVDLNLSAQRTIFDVRSEAKDALQEWIEEYIDTMFFDYLSGATTTAYHSTNLGGNTMADFASNRIVYGGTATAKANVTSSDTFDLTVLDKLRELATLASPTMRPGNFGGKKMWVCIMHPRQVYDLRTNTNTGQWLDIQKSAMQGGKVSDNPIWGDALGVYNDIMLVESTRVKTFSDYGSGGNLPAARALFLGAQAGVVAYGQNTDEDGQLSLAERTFDYGKRYGIGATLIWGLQRSKFNGQSDFASVAVDTYAASHT